MELSNFGHAVLPYIGRGLSAILIAGTASSATEACYRCGLSGGSVYCIDQPYAKAFCQLTQHETSTSCTTWGDGCS